MSLSISVPSTFRPWRSLSSDHQKQLVDPRTMTHLHAQVNQHELLRNCKRKNRQRKLQAQTRRNGLRTSWKVGPVKQRCWCSNVSSRGIGSWIRTVSQAHTYFSWVQQFGDQERDVHMTSIPSWYTTREFVGSKKKCSLTEKRLAWNDRDKRSWSSAWRRVARRDSATWVPRALLFRLSDLSDRYSVYGSWWKQPCRQLKPE